MSDDTPKYDSTEEYKGHVIKRFPFVCSAGAAVGVDTGQSAEVQYYRYHIFKADAASGEPLQKTGTPEQAKQFIDAIDS